MLRYFNFEPSFKLREIRVQEIGSSNPPVSLELVIQIDLEHDTNRSLKLGSKLKYLNINQLLLS